MSFGFYRPTRGVAGGHRELSSDRSLHDVRRQGEQHRRQENPITHQAPYPSASGRPPSGNLGLGLRPSKGPLDHMTVADKDVPAKRVDPTKNQSNSFGVGMGAACVPSYTPEPPRAQSRLTETSGAGEVFGPGKRERTPEPRRTPGQVVRSGIRPKDSLATGLVSAEPPDQPLGLLRKAGSGAAGVGSGGSVHLVAGPCGFVPAGPPRPAMDLTAGMHGHGAAIPFRRVCGAGSALRSSSAHAVMSGR